jgi:acetyltransferase-like isoleucine patch superfamily enzyme
MSNVRKIFKVLSSPRLAVALLNAQLAMLGRTRPPLSVRLYGRIYLKGAGKVSFGEAVCIQADVLPVEIVSYDRAQISIGDRTFINYGASITAYEKVAIGSDCLLGHNLRVMDCNEHGLEQRNTIPAAAPVTIGDRVWIGANVIILPGVSIGHGSAIGAGSVVTKDIPVNVIAAGNPARVLREIQTAPQV